jgi:N-formylglutamate amidohydrolase
VTADLPPIRVRLPAAEPIALVLDSPHSGTDYPEDFAAAVPLAVLRQAEDTHVAELFGSGPSLGATLIEARFPRAYIDANRALEDLDPELLAEPWPEPLATGPKTRLGIGLIWRLARGGVPMYGRKLSHEEVRRRIDRFWRPYHAALERVVEERHAAFGEVWLVNCHSMPSVGDALSTDPGRARPDFVIGDRDGTTCTPAFTELVVSTLRGLGYDVAVNDPYKGVEIVRRHGRPGQGRHSLQVEINRRLYMDEISLEPHAGYAALKSALDTLLDAIGAFVRTRGRGRPEQART